MTLAITDFIVLISMTTILSTASTTVIVYRSKVDLETKICNKITKLHERINDIAVRMGIVENMHSSKCPIE